MRRYTLPALFSLLLLPAYLLAEETNTAPPPTAAVDTQSAGSRVTELEQLLANSELERSQLNEQLEANLAQSENAQLLLLRQENQRLKLKVKEAQAQQPPRWLSEQQTWFALGGGGAALCVLLGALIRGKRRQQREWFN